MKKRSPWNNARKAVRSARAGGLGAFLLVASLVTGPSSAPGQAVEGRGNVPQELSSSSKGNAVSPAEIIRAIQDPHSGERWLLVRNEDHPGGPGRLLPADTRLERSLLGLAAGLAPKSKVMKQVSTSESPVIHAGDRLVVEEHTKVADVRLEAVALEPAKPGATLTVRLKIGGRVERAVALEPGRAALGTVPAATPEALP